MAFDYKKARALVNSGQEQAFFRTLARDHGICFDEAGGKPRLKLPGMAMDAPTPGYLGPQSELVTVANAGIPWQFFNYIDPKLIPVLLAPTMAAVIAGETMVGNWVMETAMFPVGESEGEWSSYGDYSTSGSADVNYNFPQRQNHIFQSFIQYGDREVARAAEAKRDLPSDKQGANAIVLNKGLNNTYMFGVSGLQNYGLLNDPFLPPPITPTHSWIESSAATANTIYQDIVRLWTLLNQQSQGTVQKNSPMVLAMSPTQASQLSQITMYNTNSVLMLIKQNFPNIRLEQAPEYATSAGQVIQLIAEEIDGVRTVECAFSVKMMAFRQVAMHSSISQKRASGSWGTIWRRRQLVAQMLDSGSVA